MRSRPSTQLDPDVIVERLADPDRTLTRQQVRRLHAHLAGLEVALPDSVRAVVDGELSVVPAEDAVVVDRPDLLPRVAPYAVVPVPLEHARTLAGTLDLAVASELLDDGFEERDGSLLVSTAGGEQVEVDWVAVGDADHVVGVTGRAKAMAWRQGDWSRRHAILAELRGDGELAEQDLDPV